MALGLATATALDMAKTEAMDEAVAMARGLACHFTGLQGKADPENFTAFPVGKQTARTHARTETEIDFPVGLTPPTSVLTTQRRK